MFLAIPAVLNEEQLATVRASLNSEQAPWVDGRVSAGHQGVHVKNNQQLNEASPMARELKDFVLTQLERHALFISAVLPNKVYPPMFNRYGEGMHFGTHVDGTVRMIPGSAQKLRTDLSATLFLSDSQAYDGGELVVESDFGSRSAKLAAGDMIVYSSTSRHRVNPVTRGRRLASVFWIQSLIRDDAQRAQLFELDGTIQRLTRSGADADSLVRLTAHYHGLLRAWTEI
ncbi:MAG TPA: Fe2+-dependent dioxygenase [Steroidobacteraceae bacterium]|jgi:PKHD-type hydroxylase|nr:Fe2+-dependent dioxygenase [Steroidobacteraceae bacterium]